MGNISTLLILYVYIEHALIVCVRVCCHAHISHKCMLNYIMQGHVFCWSEHEERSAGRQQPVLRRYVFGTCFVSWN
jgi:hypothetical protein